MKNDLLRAVGGDDTKITMFSSRLLELSRSRFGGRPCLSIHDSRRGR